jgi:hypothetical protein
MLKNLSDKVETYNIGLSDCNGSLTFYERQPDGGTNGFTEYGWHEENSYPVSVMKLDDFNINNISLIKIDVEGHELQVIKGAIETLKRNNYPPILFECWEPEPQGRHTARTPIVRALKDNLFGYLTEIGYEINNTSHPEIFLATVKQ